MMQRILLGQLTSNGDCLYTTTVARQIKHDFPGCHLTWAISSLCRKVIDNNPDVDDVWEVPMNGWGEMTSAWRTFEAEAWREVSRGRFERAFLTQISPDRFANYDGTVRPSIFRGYPYPITVPVDTVINLTDEEKQRVAAWTEKHKLGSFKYKVLIECSSKSGQSFMTPAMAVLMAQHLLQAEPEACVIFSTHEKVPTDDGRFIHAGDLSLREIAPLTHAVDLFIGCGSGVTVVATSGAARRDLPNIQVLKRSTSVYASFKHDFEYFKKPAGHFLELTSVDGKKLAAIALSVLKDGISEAKRQYEQPLPLTFDWYFELIDTQLLQRHQYVDAARSLMATAERYGWNADLKRFARALVLPFVHLDERAIHPGPQQDIERFREIMAAQKVVAAAE